MAQLSIDIGGGQSLVFHFLTVRTQSFTVEPVTDPSGVDYECSKVTLDILGVVNAVTIATNKADVRNVGRAAAGDRLPLTMYNLRDVLMHQRRRVTYSVGDDVVIDLPGLGGNGRQSCDAKCGPFPQRASWSDIAGEKSAILNYSVVCYDSYSSNYCLSNRWSVTSSIDRHGWTTRTISGRACFRKDQLLANRATADDYRRVLMCPTPDGMRRVGVEVTVDPTGTTAEYVVVDREVAVGLGEDSPVLEVTGSVTSSIATPFKNLREYAGVFTGVLGNAWELKPIETIKSAVVNTFPINTNVGTCKVVGRKDTPRRMLSYVAINFLLDRFDRLLNGVAPRPAQNAPAQDWGQRWGNVIAVAEAAQRGMAPNLNALWGVIGRAPAAFAAGLLGQFPALAAAAGLAQATLEGVRQALAQLPAGITVHVATTHSLDSDNSPTCEARMEVMGLSLGSIDRTLRSDPDGLLNLDSDYAVMNRQVRADQAAAGRRVEDVVGRGLGSPQLPASGNTRGSQLFALLTQALSAPPPANAPQTSLVPAEPPATQFSQDIKDLR